MLLGIIIALLILLLMITIHEFGHYIAGKALGFKINEFAIGFGPKIFSKTNNDSGEVFSIRALPLGGFCAFDEENEEATKEGSFNSKPPWKRLIVILAGVTFNFLFGIILAMAFLPFMGESQLQVLDFSADSSAAQVMQTGDIILKIDGKSLYLIDSATADLEKYMNKADNDVVITVDRNGEIIDLTLTRGEDGYFGLKAQDGYMQIINYKFSYGQALLRSLVFCFKTAGIIIVLLFKLLTFQLGLNSGVAGTIGTISVMSKLVMLGFDVIIKMIILISLNLAVFNLFPIPALDGGRAILILLEWIFKKPVISRKTEAIINSATMLILFALVIFFDIYYFFFGPKII